ncbi:MAG: rhodanese-like domain-containing protein [Caldilineales bacterium]|nr:rhodanese-like domain-containing protein [Caldilineales bacterium]
MKPSPKPSPSRWPLILVGAGLALLILVIALALAPPALAPPALAPPALAPPALAPPALAPTPAAPVAVNVSDIPRATLAEAKAAFDAGSALFLDVRDAGSYETSHIAGAESIPLTRLEQELGKLDKGRWIITYCT